VLTALTVIRLDEATERKVGMTFVTSEGPGPIWQLVPLKDDAAVNAAKGIRYGEKRDVSRTRLGLKHEIFPVPLEPGIRYKVVIKAKGGIASEAEFTALANSTMVPES